MSAAEVRAALDAVAFREKVIMHMAIFAGESGKPVWRDTLLYDHIRAKLEPLGLGWVDFQGMSATNAASATA